MVAKVFSAYALATAVTDDDLFLLDQKQSNGSYITKTVKRPAIFGGKLFFLSKIAGVYGDASFSDPTVGHDDSVAVQAAINAAPAGSTFVVDSIFRLGNIKLRSGDTVVGFGGSYNQVAPIYPASGVIQAAGTICVFRNVNWLSPYNGGTPVTDFSTIIDHDITIRDLFIHGNRGTGGANNAAGGAADSRFLDNDGYNAPSKIGITPLMFFGVRHLRAERLFFYDPDTMCILGAYLDDFGFDDIRVLVLSVYNSRNTPETLSIHGMSAAAGPIGGNIFGAVALSGNVNGGFINNVTGYFDGSLVAIQTDWIGDQSYGQNIAAYHPILYPGPATNIQITNVRANLAAAFVCLWSGGVNAGTHYSSLIDRVSCHGASGTSFQGFIFLDGPAAETGTHGTEDFTDFSVRFRCGTYGFMPVWVEGNHVDLRFKNIRFAVDAATTAGVTGFAVGVIWVNVVGSIQVLAVEGLSIYDAVTSLVYDGVYLSGFQAGTIELLKIMDSHFYRTATASGALVNDQSSGWVTNTVLGDCYLRNVSNAVKYKNSANGLGITGLTHIGANGGSSVSIPTGKTLARLRTAGLNTVLRLSGGGTVTSDKTDATEDG